MVQFVNGLTVWNIEMDDIIGLDLSSYSGGFISFLFLDLSIRLGCFVTRCIYMLQN